MSNFLAIDFGTTNSLLARREGANGAIKFVRLADFSGDQPARQNAQNGPPPLIPSLLYVLDGCSGDALLGYEVLKANLHRHEDVRFFRNFKRGILTSEQTDHRLIDGVPWTDADAGRRFLQGLLDALLTSGDVFDQLIVTAPVAAFDGYLSWLSQGMQGFPVDRVRMVDESTAAALGYSVTKPGAVLLVFDFGGGSLDLSLVQLPQCRDKTGGLLENLQRKTTQRRTAHVIAKKGTNLGGSDVDQWVLDEALDRLGLEPVGASLSASLLAACEKAKIRLSSQDAVEIRLTIEGKHHQLHFERADLEHLLETHGFYDRIRILVERTMHVAQQQGIFAEDVHAVLMVGGASLMPSVQRLLQEIFPRTSVRVEKPFTAIAEGALAMAAGLGLDDYLLHSYGLRYLDRYSGQYGFDEIIPMGSRYPSQHPVEVTLAAAHIDQAEVEFIIGEADDEKAAAVEVQYEDGKPVFIARPDPEHGVTLLNAEDPPCVSLPSPGKPGDEWLKASFIVDDQRRLHLKVIDLHRRAEVCPDLVIAHLGNPGGNIVRGEITGREPALPDRRGTPAGRRLSLRGLGTLLNLLPPGSVSLDASAAALQSEDFYVRFAAAEILSKRGDRDARQILQDVLDHGTPPQRASVAHHLHHCSWYSAQQMLRQALLDNDLRVRESAIYSLCMLRGPDAYALLVETLCCADDRLRLAAVWGLSREPDPGCIAALEAVLDAEDPEIRVKALEALGATQSKAALQAVLRAQTDPDVEVRYAATLSRVELEGTACLPDLAERIRRTEGVERGYMVKALFHATNYLFIDLATYAEVEAVIDALEIAIQDPLPETRALSGMPLAWIHHPLSGQVLMQAFEREIDAEVKARLLRHAIHLSSSMKKQMLAQALDAPEQLVRQAAEYLTRTYSIQVNS